MLCETPPVTAHGVAERLGVSRPTAHKLLRQVEDLGVVLEQPPGPRGQRRYVAHEVMDAVPGGEA